MHDYSESTLVEQPAIALFAELGYETLHAFSETFGPHGTLGRETSAEVVLVPRLRAALQRLNPDLTREALELAVEELTRDRSALSPANANREIYLLLKNGVKITIRAEEGEEIVETVRVIDWHNPTNNDYLLVSQFWLSGDMYKRRADLVAFVNGLPLVFIELKAAHKRLESAYRDNLRDYKDTIPQVFCYNAFIILSNGRQSKIGSMTAGWEHFSEWKKISNEQEQGVVSLETIIRGTCEKTRLLDLVENFILFNDAGGALVKLLARNHQYLGVNNALAAVHSLRANQGRLGVFWHTQGSGKSLSMVFFSQKVLRTIPGNWTFLIVTDRQELDDQIYKTFQSVGAVTEVQVQAESGEHLQRLLQEDHRNIFTLIHKFHIAKGQTYPKLSDRSDIIVITDEAHRTQYDTLALNMRNALPNAAFIGFTGTPLMVGEEKTRSVFGDYVSVYDFGQSVADGATVPLYYENRIPELQLTNANFNADMQRLLEEAELDDAQEKRLDREFAREYHLITRDDRLERIAEDIVSHFMQRGQPGKAMVVSIDKATAIRMYDKVQKHWQIYLDTLKQETVYGRGDPRGRPGTLDGRPETLDGRPGTLDTLKQETVYGRGDPRGRPGTLDDRPGTLDNRPGTLDGRPGTLDDRPGTLDGRPGTLDDRPETLDNRPGTLDNRPDPLGVDLPNPAARIAYMQETGMAVIVSQAQNEVADLREKGVDILPHRKRMLNEDLEQKFKDPTDPLRIVFVCAMWITGFDVPSLSTLYLDKPMRNHTLMQTIARVNRVFKDKVNGLIVDYIGVFRDLQKALAIYGSASAGGVKASELPVKDKSELVAVLQDDITQTQTFCQEQGIDIPSILSSPTQNFQRMSQVQDAVDTLLTTDDIKKKYLSLANTVAQCYKAILPDPAANAFSPIVALFVIIAREILSYTPGVDISAIMQDIEQLMETSVAARGYIIRESAAPYNTNAIDLSLINFDALKAHFENGRKHIEAEKLRGAISSKLQHMLQLNKSRTDYQEKFQRLIDDYNSGSANVELLFDKLLAFAQELNTEEQRHIAEQLSEEELALFDLLTRPSIELSAKEAAEVKKVARGLLESLKREKLVLDWRKKQQTRASVLTTIRTVLDTGLPRAYSKELYESKCDEVYLHIYDSYYGHGQSLYSQAS